MKASSYTPMTKRNPPYYNNFFPVLSVTLSGKKSWRSWFSAIFDSKVGPQTIAKLIFLGNRLTMVYGRYIYKYLQYSTINCVYSPTTCSWGVPFSAGERSRAPGSQCFRGDVRLCVFTCLCHAIMYIYIYIHTQLYIYLEYLKSTYRMYIYISIESLTHVSVLYT